MKKNSLTTAVVAGIAGVAGFAGLASAVNLNPDGLGQVLVFPYYTVNKSQDTMLSVVNTTNIGKAVKVRFLEGYNSRECLDFNLFLSAYDVWTAAVFDLGRTDPASGFDTPDYDPYAAEIGPALYTRDMSCTIPYFVAGNGNDGVLDEDGDGVGDPYVAFRGSLFAGGANDGGPDGVSRCREGHFEIITMGDVIPLSTLDAEITHSTSSTPNAGVPSCGDYVSNANFAAVSADLAPPTGGIYGAGSIINVGQGTFFGYGADAIEGFFAVPVGSTDNLYTESGSVFPSLGQAQTEADGSATAYVFQSGGLITSNYGDGIDAVSAVFMADNVYNEYTVNPAIGGNTDWVVTFPTKRYYVDSAIVGGTAIPPFVAVFDGASCVEVGVTVYDREEGSRTPSTCDISPCPPGPAPNQICYETNVISYSDAAVTDSVVLGSKLVKSIKPFGTSGHAILDLASGDGGLHALRPAANGNVFYGLPATGFAAQNLVNNGITVGDTTGVLSNYSGLFRHRISRDCLNGAGACS